MLQPLKSLPTQEEHSTAERVLVEVGFEVCQVKVGPETCKRGKKYHENLSTTKTSRT